MMHRNTQIVRKRSNVDIRRIFLAAKSNLR